MAEPNSRLHPAVAATMIAIGGLMLLLPGYLLLSYAALERVTPLETFRTFWLTNFVAFMHGVICLSVGGVLIYQGVGGGKSPPAESSPAILIEDDG